MIDRDVSLAHKYWKARKTSLRLKQILSKSSMIIARSLIKYKFNPCLWNVEHPFYRHSAVKSSAWNEVVKVWRELDPYANEVYVKFKVLQMRSNSMRQRQMLEVAKEKEIPYRPTLWYYHYFDFLPNPKKTPRYQDHLDKIEVIPVDLQKQPEADQTSPIGPEAVNNMDLEPEHMQPLRCETAQMNTTNILCLETTTDTSTEMETTSVLTETTTRNRPGLIMATTDTPIVMETANGRDQTTTTNIQALMATTDEPTEMETTNELTEMITTNLPTLMATTDESTEMETTSGLTEMITTNLPALIATTDEPTEMETTSGLTEMTTRNLPALMATTDESTDMETTSGLAQTATTYSSDSSQNLSDEDSRDYLLLIERDEIKMQYVAYELNENEYADFRHS